MSFHLLQMLCNRLPVLDRLTHSTRLELTPSTPLVDSPCLSRLLATLNTSIDAGRDIVVLSMLDC